MLDRHIRGVSWFAVRPSSAHRWSAMSKCPHCGEFSGQDAGLGDEPNPRVLQLGRCGHSYQLGARERR